jgi:pimeloyl-ACP methyl ester carboxylesterase
MGLAFKTGTSDGRTLDVYVDGPEGAVPLLFHNGTPSAGELYAPFVEEARQRGLRMASFSRAGYGSSTRNAGRSVADVIPDVAAVLDELRVQRCYTLGWSGGGPHALACAALLPSRLIGSAIVGGLAPYDAAGLDWMADMGEENIAVFNAALAGYAELQVFLEHVGPSFATITPDEVVATLGTQVPDVDRSAINESSTWLADIFRESVRNGIGGWQDDELAFVRPWGFDLGDIQVPVTIWQGSQDRNTPAAHGEWLASHIPGATLHRLPDHGHVSLGMHSFGQILDDLLTTAPASS